MRKLLLILALSLPLMGHGQFSTVTCTHGETGVCRQATTCNQSDVQATVNASAAGSTGVTTPNAFGGDGVYVPAGSCTWTSSVAWTNKNIEILGGVGGTTTINNTSVDTFDPVVSNNGATAAAFRISGFSFNASSSGHLVNVNQQNPNLTSWAGYFRIDDITINSTSSGNVIAIWGPVWGLIDHINVTWTGGNFLEQGDFLNSECVVSPGNSAVNYMGEYSGRILPIALGTQEAVYVEDSTLNYTGSYAGGISDSESGGQRMVFRHNTVTGSTYHYAHWTRGGDGGYCYNGEWDGHKYEIYNNTYNGGGGPALYPMRFGSGTGVIFNNTITGYSSLTLNIDETRGAGGEVTNQTPLSCDGSQPIDGNAGDASAPGWPCAGQIGFACKAGSCSRTTMDSVPLLAWNNGAQTGCSTGGSCTNTFNLTVDGCQGSGNCQPTQTRPMANYIKSTAHSVSGALNGAFDYCQGTTTAPSSCGIYTNSYAPYVYPHPLHGGGGGPTYNWTVTATNGSVTGTNCATATGIASGTTIGPCTAVPNAGYAFSSWSGVSGSAACSGATNPCPSFAITANSAATANFTAVCTLGFSPASGTYTGTQNVTISKSSCPTGTTIYYRTDGLPATVIDTAYSSPVAVASSQTLTAIAVLNPSISDQPQTTSSHWKYNGIPVTTFPCGVTTTNSGGVAGTLSDFCAAYGSPATWSITTTDSTSYDISGLPINTPTVSVDTAITRMSFREVYQDTSNCTQSAGNFYKCVDVAEIDGENFFQGAGDSTGYLKQASTRCSTNEPGSSGNSGFMDGDASSGSEKWDIPCDISKATDLTVNVHWVNGDTSCSGAVPCMVFDSIYRKEGSGTTNVYNFPAVCDSSDTLCPNYPMNSPAYSDFMLGVQNQVYARKVSVAGTSPLTVTRSISFIRVGVDEGNEATGSAAYVINVPSIGIILAGSINASGNIHFGH